MKSGIKDVTIPLSQIASITLNKGMWSTKIIVRGKSLRTVAEIPGCEREQAVLCIDRKDRDLAENFVLTLQLHLSEQALKQIEEEPV
jgi:hypothetical protein